MISKSAFAEFKTILLKDYDYSADDKTILQLANDFLTSFEAVLTERRLTKIQKRGEDDN